MLKLLGYGIGVISISWASLDIAGFSINQVTGRSMQPTLNPDCYNLKTGKSPLHKWLDWVLVVQCNGARVKDGDIVIINNPLVPKDKDIKRIIATENQIVRTKTYKNRVVVVPEGHLWLEGDNHKISKDSNCYGPVPASLVTGKAVAIIFPFSRWQWLKPEIPQAPYQTVNASEKVPEELHDSD